MEDHNARSPTISVVMSVYNTRRYVGQAVESILAQTFGDFEFIIIDDGSTDGSLDILKEYAARDERIRLISRPNTGLTRALNEGVRLARGRYLARMDADDVSLPRRFERQIAHLESNPDCVALGTRVRIVDAEGDPVCIRPDELEHGELDRAFMSGRGQVMFHPSIVFRTESVRGVGGYSESFRYAQDLDLFLRLSERGRVENLPEVLLEYREHLSKVGHTRRDEQMRTVYEIIRQAHRRRGLPISDDWMGGESLNALSRVDQLRKWAWWALKGRNVKTARKHAWRSILLSPWSLSSWRVMYCAIRGY